MFFCLAGMVASLKLITFFELSSINAAAPIAENEVLDATKSLLIPFITWTVIYYLRENNDGTLGYFYQAILDPGITAWFLIALFYCRILFALIRVCISFMALIINRVIKCNFFIFNNINMSFIVIITFYLIIYRYVPDAAGLSYLKMYFVYYIFGIFLYKLKDKIWPHLNFIACICLFLFCALMPFWHIAELGPIERWLSAFMEPAKALRVYHFVVAICGTFAFLGAVKLLVRANPLWLNAAFAFIGRMTLGVYVVHWRFIWMKIPPTFLGPFAASLLTAWVIGKTPVARLFLLGKASSR